MAKNTSTAFLISVALLGLAPLAAYATQGACSYHSGVNCSAGGNYNGNVTCNDGWVNSSVLYSDADECKNTNICKIPDVAFQLSCTSESSYARVQQRVSDMRGQQGAINARRGIPWDSSSIGQDELDSCRRDIDLYNAMVKTSEECWDQHSKQANQKAGDVELMGQIKLDAFCVQYHGIGSVWDKSLPPDNITAQCTPSRDAQIDAAFQRAFKPAMDGLPEYVDIVDSEVIKKLSLDPINGDKTFTQIIIERYGDELALRKASAVALAEKTKADAAALSAQIEPSQLKPIITTKKKIKAISPTVSEKEVSNPIQDKIEIPKPAIIKIAAVARPVKRIWWRRVSDWLGF